MPCLHQCRGLLDVAAKHNGILPPVAFFQFDNCSRENKNWIMFSYLSWLVASKVFRKVHLGFLIVGYDPHTPHQHLPLGPF